jgi:hypothetical protein
MPDPKPYTGGCHCGAVRWRVHLDLGSGLACNCSICQKTGTLLAFGPGSAFTLLSGEESLTDYQFGKRRLHHLFCARCGVRSFARGAMPDGTPTVAINVRCLDEVDLAAIPVRNYDGRAIPIDG